MKIFPINAHLPKSELINSLGTFTRSVKEHYVEYVNNGFYRKMDEKGLYIYQIGHGENHFTGVLGSVEVADVNSGRIVKHENTLASKEQDMMYLLMERSAMIKPVLLSYPDQWKVTKQLNSMKSPQKVVLRINDSESGEEHIVWKMDDADAQKIQAVFEKIPAVYIADGHHRTSAQSLLYNNAKDERMSHLFCAFFSFENLRILDYNRVVQVTSNKPGSYTMALLSSVFNITPMKEAAKPTSKYELTMYMDHEWFKLQWKKEVFDNYIGQNPLDADLFNKHVLHDLVGIENIREDSRIKYVDGTVSVDDFMLKVLKTSDSLGFLLYPVAVQDLKEVADAGGIMPPKSTYFEPRMLNGLVTQHLKK